MCFFNVRPRPRNIHHLKRHQKTFGGSDEFECFCSKYLEQLMVSQANGLPSDACPMSTSNHPMRGWTNHLKDQSKKNIKSYHRPIRPVKTRRRVQKMTNHIKHPPRTVHTWHAFKKKRRIEEHRTRPPSNYSETSELLANKLCSTSLPGEGHWLCRLSLPPAFLVHPAAGGRPGCAREGLRTCASALGSTTGRVEEKWCFVWVIFQ